MKPLDKVFKVYFDSNKPDLYFNQIKELSGLSDSSLNNTLKKLVQNNILKKNAMKSNTFYSIFDQKRFSLEFSKIALDKFNSLNREIRIPLIDLKKYFNYKLISIILLGSSSRNDESVDSDIDLMIISDINFPDLSEIKQIIKAISNFPLSIFEISSNDFIKSNDYLIKEAKSTGFPIKGEQFFYEVILDEYCGDLQT
jgi:predicted nucleotidyltransferase